MQLYPFVYKSKIVECLLILKLSVYSILSVEPSKRLSGIQRLKCLLSDPLQKTCKPSWSRKVVVSDTSISKMQTSPHPQKTIIKTPISYAQL